jgi:uncharacterized membrane protein
MNINRDYLMVALLILMLTAIVSIMSELTVFAAEHSYTGVAITFAGFTGLSIWMLLTFPLSYFRFLKSRK